MSGIETVQPLRELSHYAKPLCPGLETRMAGGCPSLQEQGGANVIGAIAFGKGVEGTQYRFVRAKMVTQTSPDRQIPVELLLQVTHFPPPAPGQG